MTNKDYAFIVGALALLWMLSMVQMIIYRSIINIELCIIGGLLFGTSLLFFMQKRAHDFLASALIKIINHFEIQKTKDDIFIETFNQLFDAFDDLSDILPNEKVEDIPEIAEKKVPLSLYINKDPKCFFPHVLTEEEADWCNNYQKFVDGKINRDQLDHICSTCVYWKK